MDSENISEEELAQHIDVPDVQRKVFPNEPAEPRSMDGASFVSQSQILGAKPISMS